jgi:hypothetical protein
MTQFIVECDFGDKPAKHVETHIIVGGDGSINLKIVGRE